MSKLSDRVRAAASTRWRSARDLCAYVIQHELVFAVGLSAMALGLVPVLPFEWVKQLGWAIFVIGTLLSAGLLWRDTHALVARLSGWEFEELRPVFGTSARLVDPDLPVRVHTSRGSILVDPDLDRALGSHAVPLAWRDEPFHLEGELRANAASMVRRSTSARRPHNGHCVRLESNLSGSGVDRGDLAVLREARYFDALCSNQLTGWNITKDGQAWPFRERYLFSPREPDAPADLERLQPLGSSALANIVGTSTLAVTTDDHLLIVLQSRNSGSSAQLRAPSGSGSLEPGDLGPEPRTLNDTVLRGAERELREECGLAEDQILGSTLIGFGRWLEHGGKPEFMALTALDLPVGEIQRTPRWSSAEEAIWTQSVRTHPLSMERLAQPGCDPYTYPESFASLVTGDPLMAGTASLPLEWGLRCLSAAMMSEPTILSRLRSSSVQRSMA